MVSCQLWILHASASDWCGIKCWGTFQWKKNQKGINKGPHNKTGGDPKIIKKLKPKKMKGEREPEN